MPADRRVPRHRQACLPQQTTNFHPKLSHPYVGFWSIGKLLTVITGLMNRRFVVTVDPLQFDVRYGCLSRIVSFVVPYLRWHLFPRRVLGTGRWCTAYEAQGDDNLMYSMKIGPSALCSLAHETRILRHASRSGCGHTPRVVCYGHYGSFDVLITDVVALPLTQWAESIPSHLRCNAVVTALPLICAALHALHRAGIVHRDLKPQHILWTRSRWYIIDFGSAYCADVSSSTHEFEYTVQYASHRVLSGMTLTTGFSIEDDVESLALCLKPYGVSKEHVERYYQRQKRTSLSAHV